MKIKLDIVLSSKLEWLTVSASVINTYTEFVLQRTDYLFLSSLYDSIICIILSAVSFISNGGIIMDVNIWKLVDFCLFVHLVLRDWLQWISTWVFRWQASMVKGMWFVITKFIEKFIFSFDPLSCRYPRQEILWRRNIRKSNLFSNIHLMRTKFFSPVIRVSLESVLFWAKLMWHAQNEKWVYLEFRCEFILSSSFTWTRRFFFFPNFILQYQIKFNVPEYINP